MNRIHPIIVFVVLSSCVFATWQETLESEFDIVDTFDNLQDWFPPSGVTVGYYEDNPEYFPVTLNGSASGWTYFSNYDGTDSCISDAIGSDGEVWQGTKSMCINYQPVGGASFGCNMSGVSNKGYGPDRMVKYFGEYGNKSSGYHEINTFYMQRLADDFFRTYEDNGETKFYYGAIIKMLVLQTGFTNGNDFECPDSSITRPSYGYDFIIDQYSADGTSYDNDAWSLNSYRTPQRSVDDCGYNTGDLTQARHRPELKAAYLNGDWYGIERRSLMNSAAGVYDGEDEIWVYYDNGTLLYHNLDTGLNLRPYLDTHLYNRIEFGGNYQCNAGYPDSWGNDTKFYVDDFIIDDEIIGPTYFSLLENYTPIHDADTDEDGTISTVEVRAYHTLWKAGIVSLTELIDVLQIWKRT